MTDRRAFLGRAAAAALATPLFGTAVVDQALARRHASTDELEALADPSDQSERYWQRVRNHFLLSDRGIYLNNGTHGPAPLPVVQAVIDHMRAFNAVFTPRAYDLQALKGALARFTGAEPHQIVITRNTTESMNFVANGLELEPGDEVLTSDHEHIGGLCPWQLVAARRKLVLRQLRLPVPPENPEDVVRVFSEAVTPSTRVISLSHVTFTTGLVTPVEQLARFCRARDIIFVVDGAHPLGMMPLDIFSIGCDFYASSPHKWLLAPQGTGFLWMRDQWLDRLWPTIASGGWDDLSLKSDRFNHLGTLNDSLRVGLGEAIEFQNRIGVERIWERVLTLKRYLHEKLTEIPQIEIVTTRDPHMESGMVSFLPRTMQAIDLQNRLWRIGPVRTRVIGEYDYGYMRLSTHIYNSFEQLDRTVDLIHQVLKSG